MKRRIQLACAALLGLTACAKPAPPDGAPKVTIDSCKTIKTDFPGSEDIVVAGDVAFISSDPQRGGQKDTAAVYAYDLKTGALARAADSASLRFSLHPHGMGLYQEGSGNPLLFVLNHRTGGSDVVEIFRVAGTRLERVDSVAGQELVRGNDLVPVGPRSFYVSNTLVSTSGAGELWERLTGSRRSSILFYDGRGFTPATRPFRYANGVNVSRDRRHLYVAAYGDKTFYTFDRADDKDRSPRNAISLGSHLDNIDIDSAGGVWIAAHGSTTKLVQYMRAKRATSPWEVLYLPAPNGSDPVWSRARIDGRFPQAASVAVRHGNRLLIGSVGDYPAICRVTVEPAARRSAPARPAATRPAAARN
jgi:arylesterase/paraoxonase